MLETSNLPEIISIFPGVINRVYFQNPETKEFWFHATSVCETLGFSNVTSALTLHCDNDEKFQEIWNGKATWFVSEAGCYGLAMGAKNEVSKKFKRWLKHEVLPKLRSQGYYIAKTDDVTLAALQAEVTNLKSQNKMLLTEHCYHTMIEKFVADNFVSKFKGTQDKYVDGGDAWVRFQYWSKSKFAEKFIVEGLPALEISRFYLELDRYFKSLKSAKSVRFHIDAKNGCGDIENAALVSKSDMGNFDATVIYQIGE